MPQPSWDSALPFQQTYLQQIRRVCEASGVTIYDFSKLIPDPDYADSIHLAPKGIEGFQSASWAFALITFARRALRRATCQESLEFHRSDR